MGLLEDHHHSVPGPGKEEDRLARAVIGAAIDVHRGLGPGYQEAVYEDALAVEFSLRNISFARQYSTSICYKGQQVGAGKIDFLVGDRLVVELKAVESLLPLHLAQVISYLKATGSRLGLLLNFNVPVMKEGIRRVAL